ncbi:MAG: hypothetical protein ACRDHU_08030 [Actinomycetota bacterium]
MAGTIGRLGDLVPGGNGDASARRSTLDDDLAELPTPLVLVEWHDAWFDFDLPAADERRTDYLVRTVGFLVAEDPRFLSLAQEVLPEGEGFGPSPTSPSRSSSECSDCRREDEAVYSARPQRSRVREEG